MVAVATAVSGPAVATPAAATTAVATVVCGTFTRDGIRARFALRTTPVFSVPHTRRCTAATIMGTSWIAPCAASPVGVADAAPICFKRKESRAFQGVTEQACAGRSLVCGRLVVLRTRQGVLA